VEGPTRFRPVLVPDLSALRHLMPLRWAALLTLVLGCAGKQPSDQKVADSVPAVDLVKAREAILTQVRDAPCASPSLCRTIGFGEKACGGPRQYLVYSKAATDSARLAREVARYNEAERNRNREEGRVSDCMALSRPQVSCVSGRCRAATSGVQ
jgi:hypothetical protein